MARRLLSSRQSLRLPDGRVTAPSPGGGAPVGLPRSGLARLTRLWRLAFQPHRGSPALRTLGSSSTGVLHHREVKKVPECLSYTEERFEWAESGHDVDVDGGAPLSQEDLHLDLADVGINTGAHRLMTIELRGGGLVLSLLAQPHHTVHGHADEDTDNAKDDSAAKNVLSTRRNNRRQQLRLVQSRTQRSKRR